MPFFRPYGWWYCTDAKTMLDLHARLHRPTIGFKHLLIDPTTIDDHNWELNSPEVRSVARELEYLADAVKIQVQPGLPLEALQIFEEAYNRCMVAVWPTLVLWLDLLHPMHHKGTPRHADVPMEALAGAMYSIFVAGGAEIAALRAQTPHLYRLLFDLWLRADEYVRYEVDRYAVMDILICAARSATPIWRERMKDLTEDCADEPDITGRDLDSLMAASRHPEGTAALLSAAQNRPRHAYRMVVTLFISLATQAVARPDDRAINRALKHQIDAVCQLAEEPLSLNAHSRSTIHALVDILRTLQDFRIDGDPAIGVIHLLATIWRSCKDGRSIAWAIEYGVLPVMRHTQYNLDIYKRLVDDAIWFVAQSTFHLRVARAFATEDRAFSFRCADYMHPRLIATTRQRISERVRSASHIYTKDVCSNQTCTHQKAERKVRRCPCLNAGYCSKECQRADWPVHRHICNDSRLHVDHMRSLGVSVLSKHRLMDVYFIGVCARDFLFANGFTVIKSIDDFLQNTPPMRSAHAIILKVDVARVHCEYSLSVAPRPLSHDNTSTPLVTARSTPLGYWRYEFPDDPPGTANREAPVHIIAKVPYSESGEGIHVMAVGLASLRRSVGMYEPLWHTREMRTG